MRFLLTRGRIPFLVVLALATGFFASLLPSLEIDPSNRSMNAERPAEAAIDREFREAFGAEDEILVAVATPRLLDRQGLELLARLTEQIGRLPGVRRVTSLANARQLVSGPEGATLAPLLSGRVEHALDRNPHLTGLLVSADRRTAAIVVEPDAMEGTALAALIAELRRIQKAESAGDVSLHLTGLPVAKHDVARLVDRDQLVLVPACLALLAGLLALAFRRASGVLLPLAVTGVSLVATLGIYSWSGLALNPITSLLPPVIVVLSFMTSVHLYHGWLAADRRDPVERILAVVRSLAKPAFFAAFTTAVGFGSLVIGDTPAVQHFGAFAALGVILSYGVGMTLVPVALTWLAMPEPSEPADRPAVARLLARIARFSTNHPAEILLVAGGLTAVAALGIPRIVSDTDLVRFLKSNEPLVQDTRFVDRALTGPSTIELLVARRDGTPLARVEDLRRLAALAEGARREPQVTGVLSIVPIVEQIHRAETRSADLALPTSDDEVAIAYDLLGASDDPDVLRQVADASFTRLRVRVAVHAIGSAEAARLVDRLVDLGRTALGPDYRLAPSGAFVRFALDSNRLVESQVTSFGFGYLMVFLAIGIMLRSVGLVLISMVPNVMPLVWTGGLMGFSGIELSAGTAMIASAVIGLVVDDTIHYLVHFAREEERLGTVAAVHHTTTGIGAALATASLVLAVGFWVGALGSFRPTIYFSALTGWTMLSGVVCELFVLPACLIFRSRLRGRGARTRAVAA